MKSQQYRIELYIRESGIHVFLNVMIPLSGSKGTSHSGLHVTQSVREKRGKSVRRLFVRQRSAISGPSTWPTRRVDDPRAEEV